MTRRVLVATLVLGALALAVWRAELFTVQRPGEKPRALAVLPVEARRPAQADAVLPSIPVGMHHLRAGDGVTLIHYWAPWQQHAAAQAAELDSLSHLEELAGLHVAIVCFDPFPSVARYVARRRLRVAVMLDPEKTLRKSLPCPSIPYTYVLDADGSIAAAQAGEVLWLDEATRRSLKQLLAAPPDRPAASPPS